MIRIGVDVGGTFTDVVVLDEEGGQTSWFKTLTDRERPAKGVLAAIEQSTVPLTSVSRVKLGTTLALNAILTRSGATVGLLTTEGFRDVLEIRRTHRNTLFDLDEQLPDPLVPRDLRAEVKERVAFDGSVVTPLDDDGVRRAWRQLRDKGATTLAITFLFSFENGAHEERAREIVMEEGGAEAIFISSEVLPAYREYERTSTTVVAAYVAPAVRGYLSELSEALEAGGMPPRRLSVLTNSGGAMNAQAAGNMPVPTLLSGPAGGVAAMQWLARAEGLGSVLTLDMGGTSTDVSGVVEGVVDERLDMEIDGHVVSYPTFDIQTIGAGGGSIGWIDSGGSLRVGPQSAGSDPGPACYGLGGTEPTVTDANLVLGRYSADVALGGLIKPDPELARSAIEGAIAEPLEISVEEAAAGIVRIVNSHMVNAVRTISVERGRDPREFTLAAFGGAGPVHAAEIARELSIPRVMIPAFPGCASAFGAAVAKTRRDYLRTIARQMDGLDPERIGEVVDLLGRRALAGLAEEGFGEDQIHLETWMNLRYRGQAYDLAIRHELAEITAQSLEGTAEAFHALHERHHGHSFSDVPVELVNVRVTGFGVPSEPSLKLEWGVGGAAFPTREVYFEEVEGYVEARVLDRVELDPSIPVVGPAIVHQADSTILIPPGSAAAVGPGGSLMLEAAGVSAEDARVAEVVTR
jgi:N-methylhydantoinase A